MNNKLRIMVVDDEPIVGKRLKRLFEKAGYDVETFTESSTAAEKIEKSHFDIIITDLKMEVVDGIKILEIAKKKNPDTQVIIITGYSRRYTSSEAIDKGALEFITKPFRIDDLKKAVQKAEKELIKNNARYNP
jgi:DNA-binding NtrC family response regulator